MPTQAERNAETRRRLLVAAREVFAELGYANAGVNDVVARAERARGSFYLHFVNKEAVLASLLEDLLEHSVVADADRWQWQDGDGAYAAILQFIEEYAKDRDLWLLLDQRSSLEPALKAMSDQFFDKLVDSIAAGMASAHPDGLVSGLDARAFALLFAAMLSDSTRAPYQEHHAWQPAELAKEMATIWSRTLAYAAA